MPDVRAGRDLGEMSAVALLHIAGWVRAIAVAAGSALLLPLGFLVIPAWVHATGWSAGVAGASYVVVAIPVLTLVSHKVSNLYWERVELRREKVRERKKSHAGTRVI